MTGTHLGSARTPTRSVPTISSTAISALRSSVVPTTLTPP